MADLFIPAELPADTLGAALAYAAAGWYVLPVDPATKHPGSRVGHDWPAKSTRDPGLIHSWYTTRPGDALALHVGRSGAVVFDVDSVARMPYALTRAALDTSPPMQSTRVGDPLRGHYVFAAAVGSVGNSTGDLGPGWGDVRGLNGIVVVAPTPHSKAAEGGQYRWLRTGPLPELPAELAACLRPPGAKSGHSSAQVRAWLDALPDGAPCQAVARVSTYVEPVDGGRHEAMITAQQRLTRLGDQGHRGVPSALEALRESFMDAKPEGEDEYERALEGAVRTVLAVPTAPENRRCCGGDDAEAFMRLFGLSAYVPPGAPPAPTPEARGSRLWGSALPPGVFSGPPPPTPPYVLADLVREGELVALASEGKAGKSLFTLDRVLSAVVEGGRHVLYLDAENSLRDLHTRVHALGRADADLSGLTYLSFPSLALDVPADAAELLRFVAELPSLPHLVVFDTASRFLAGKENDSEPWLAMYRQALLPLKRAGVAVLRLDHFGKDPTKGQRGSSAKTGDVDVVWELTADEIRNGGTGAARLQLVCTHQRSGTHEHEAVFIRTPVGAPLTRHDRVGSVAGGALVGDPGDRVDAIVRALDAAGAPVSGKGSGRDAAYAALHAQFPTATEKQWTEAVRRRKIRGGLTSTPVSVEAAQEINNGPARAQDEFLRDARAGGAFSQVTPARAETAQNETSHSAQLRQPIGRAVAQADPERAVKHMKDAPPMPHRSGCSGLAGGACVCGAAA
ncbi:bifunctional DNA primase/polymerase [Phytohabitans kaempferiae]|uniref:Bifunctional DNA primase/polymerase n=1 Tax=Phytohabitans kaempferiae TaxID=1620943 RepID=A0ABV6LZH3_9ACTN